MNDKVVTSNPKLGRFLPHDTLNWNNFLRQHDTVMVLVWEYVRVLTCKHMERQILTAYSFSAITIQTEINPILAYEG